MEKLYPSTFKITQRNVTAEEIWDSDKKRIENFKKLGYNCFIIWEDDWKSNHLKVINKFKNEYV